MLEISCCPSLKSSNSLDRLSLFFWVSEPSLITLPLTSIVSSTFSIFFFNSDYISLIFLVLFNSWIFLLIDFDLLSRLTLSWSELMLSCDFRRLPWLLLLAKILELLLCEDLYLGSFASDTGTPPYSSMVWCLTSSFSWEIGFDFNCEMNFDYLLSF